jgi:predicted permease
MEMEKGAERVREECRESRGLGWLDAGQRNVRFALRLLRADPVFAATAVLTLALCIGVNAAAFSMVDAVLFRALPYPDPARLAQVVVAFEHAGASGNQSSQTGRVWEAVRDHVPALRSAVYSDVSSDVNLAGGGRVDRVAQQRVSAGFFGVLGIAPRIGREFSAAEDRPGDPSVVIVSDDAWRRLFDADRSIVGRRVFLRGEPYTVIGVMPPGFRASSKADVWTPLRPTTTGEGGGSNYAVIGRVAAGESWARAEMQVSAVGRDVLREADLPAGATARLHLVPLQQGLAEEARTPLLLLWGAVGLVLVIGCANLAGLLLSRGGRRGPEMATRIALGGGRRAVVGQLLTESAVLAVLGGAAGVVLGGVLLRLLGPSIAETLGVWQQVGLDRRVLAVTVGLSAATSLLFGLFPALRVSRVDLREALVNSGGRSVAGARRPWPRRVLVIAEVALGLALAVAAGLLVRTFTLLNDQAAGFDGKGVETAEVSLQDARYRTAASVTRLFSESLDRIRRLPGVDAAGVVLTLPYERALNLGVRTADDRSENGQVTNVCYVTSGAFRALGMSLVHGRWLDEADGAGAAPVVLVNESFVRRYLKGRDALGEPLRMAGAAREVVGVVRDVPQRSGWGQYGPLAPVPTVYVPAAQLPDGLVALVHTWFSPRWVVRSSRRSPGLDLGMQRALASTDPLLAMNGFRDIDAVRADSLASQRLRAQLMGGLAGAAIVLAVIGIYGLVSQSVAERRRELGIRRALGASTRRIVGDVALQGLALAAAGIAVGLGVAAIAAPLLRQVVWGVPLLDPWTFLAASGALLAAAAVASLVPAARVASVDPSRVLRWE